MWPGGKNHLNKQPMLRKKRKKEKAAEAKESPALYYPTCKGGTRGTSTTPLVL